MSERYEFPMPSWAGLFGLYATTIGWQVPKDGVWFWADFPDRRPYIRRR